VAELDVRVGVVVQPSLTVGVAKLGCKGQAMVRGAGSVPNTGAVVSSTVMVWATLAVLPQRLVAVQLRTMV
jgi:hypothetical protein